MIDKTYPDNLVLAIFGEEVEYSKKGLENALTTLTEREEDVLKYRYQEGKTLREVGNIYSITQERIRQVEAKALRKLRHPERAYMLKTVTLSEYNELLNKYNKLKSNYYTLTEAFASHKGIEKEEVPDTVRAILCEDKTLEELELSVRSYNVLKRHGCNTISDVAKLTTEELRKVRYMGRKSEEEILKKLHECCMRLKDE